MPIKHLCEKSESLRRELFNALTPQAEPRRVESRFDDIPRPPQQRQPIVEFDEKVEEPLLSRSRRRGAERERGRDMESEIDEDELEDTITVQPCIGREPRAIISNDSDSEDYSPASMMAAFYEEAFNQNILLDCGATCSIISENYYHKLRLNCVTPDVNYQCLEFGGKVKIKGFTRIWIDLGQRVKLQHIVGVCNIGGGYDALLGKSYLARINAKVAMRYDYLEAPTIGGVPVIIEGRRRPPMARNRIGM